MFKGDQVTLEVGKLYSCEYYILLFPDKETVVAALGIDPGWGTERSVSEEARWWSRELGKGKPVSYVKVNLPLLVLNIEDRYVQILVGDRKGWFIFKAWLELKEIG